MLPCALVIGQARDGTLGLFAALGQVVQAQGSQGEGAYGFPGGAELSDALADSARFMPYVHLFIQSCTLFAHAFCLNYSNMPFIK